VGSRAGLDRCGKSRPTGIRPSDSPARSQSLYRLSYRARRSVFKIQKLNTTFQKAKPPPETVLIRLVVCLTTWGDPDVDGRIILRWIFSKLEGVVGTGWSWLRIGTGGGHL
jgi:hypothetical protein